MSGSYDGAMARTDTASRVIAAPLDRVFAALVDPEALTAWLPPDGMSGRFERFDARPGGSYRLVLTYADASSARGKATADSDIVEARFVDVVPGVRVVQAVDFVSDDPTHAGTMTMTWEVTAVDAGTRVDIRADDVPAGISAKDHAAGLASSLANLATYLVDFIRLQRGISSREVLVSESPLSAHAGPIAVIAGGLFAVAHVGQFVVMDRSNLVTMTLDPAFRLFSAAYAITFPLMLIALVALYWREAQEAGRVRSGRLLYRGHRHRRLGWRHVV